MLHPVTSANFSPHSLTLLEATQTLTGEIKLKLQISPGLVVKIWYNVSSKYNKIKQSLVILMWKHYILYL